MPVARPDAIAIRVAVAEKSCLACSHYRTEKAISKCAAGNTVFKDSGCNKWDNYHDRNSKTNSAEWVPVLLPR